MVRPAPARVVSTASAADQGASCSKDWREAVHQLHRYQRQAPLMLTPNLFCIAGDEDEFRYGTVLFHDSSKDDIERHLDTWGRWLSLPR